MSNSVSFLAHLPVVPSLTSTIHNLHAHQTSHSLSGHPLSRHVSSSQPKRSSRAAPRKRVRFNYTPSASTSPPPSTPSSNSGQSMSSPSGSTVSEPVHGVTVSQAISSGMLRQLPAIAIRDIETLTPDMIEVVLGKLFEARQWRAVLRVFEAISQHPTIQDRLLPRLYNDAFLASMRVSSRAASKQAYSIYEGLANAGRLRQLRPKAFNFLFVCLCKSLMVDEAKIVHESCRENGFYLNRYSYNSFLNACAKTNRVEDAFFALRAMAESNITPDVVSCNVIIACCVRGDEIEVALSLLHRMPLWGISPDIYSYNSVINGFRKARMLEQAFDLVASMEIAAGIEPIEGRRPVQTISTVRPVNVHHVSNNLPDSNHHPNGNPQSMQSNENKDHERDAIEQKNDTNENLKGKKGKGGEAHDKLNGSDVDEDEFKPVRPDLVTYNTLISGIAAANAPHLDRALAVQKHMLKQRIDGNEVTYNALMATATRSGRVDEAFQIYDEMLNLDLKTLNVELFTTLITLCGQAGQMERAFRVHEEMIDAGISPSVVTFNALLTACQRGEREDAVDIAMDVLKIMRDTPGCSPDVITYSTLIDTVGRDGRFEQMRFLLETMKAEGLTPNFVTYTSMISALCKFGQLDEALQLMREMEEQGIEPNVYTFSCLVSGARRRKDMSRALQIVGMMRQKGVALNNVTYALLIQISARSGQRRWIDRVLQEMELDARLVRSGKLPQIRALLTGDDVLDHKHSKKTSQILSEIFAMIASIFGERRSDRSK